jgi:outer membrane receptor protein involved in Fe transport
MVCWTYWSAGPTSNTELSDLRYLTAYWLKGGTQMMQCNKGKEGRVGNLTGLPLGRAIRIFMISSLASLLLVPLPLRAQVGSADVLGTVTDPSGAVVSNAAVTVRNLGTAAERKATTDDRGDYVVSLLPNGSYSLKVEAPGFKAFLLQQFTLSTGDRTRIDAKLQTGVVTQSVEVTGVEATLQTDSSSVSNTVADQAVQDLPLNNRNFVGVIDVMPGVQLTPPEATTDTFSVVDRRPSTDVVANGQHSEYNNNLIDGFDNNERNNGLAGVRPSIDGIAEIKVDTNTYRAEYGRTGGAVINLITQAGTNAFHGSAYNYLRNDLFDARNFFATTGHKPEYRQNIFGGSIGGPILKNKTFFFFDIEEGRMIEGLTNLVTVPTLYEEQNPGDFTDIDFCLSATICYDHTLQVPSDQMQKIAVNLWKLIPAPNLPGISAPGTAGPVTNNYSSSQNETQNTQTIDLRIDHHFSDKNLFFARYANNPVTTVYPGEFPAVDGIYPGGNLMQFPGPSTTKSQNLQFDYVHIFNSNLLLDLKAGYSRVNIQTVPLNYGLGAADKLGIPNVYDTALPSTNVLPYFDLKAFQLGDSPSIPSHKVNNTFQYSGSMTWTHGNHSIKIGAALVRRQLEDFQDQEDGGVYPIGSQLPYYYVFANFFTGYSQVALRGVDFYVPYFRGWEPNAYVQDDWRVNSKLTVNVGLRYDVFTPWTEAHGHQSNFDLSTLSFVLGSQSPTLGVKTDYKDFAPRFGFAYSITPKTVIRGGYGFSWYPLDVGTAFIGSTPIDLISNPNPPYSFNWFTADSPNFSAGPPLPSLVDITTFATNPQVSAVTYRPPNSRPIQVQQFNLTFQREIQNYTLTAAYVGVLGNRLPRGINANQPDPPGANQPALPWIYATQLKYMQSIGEVYNGDVSNYNALQLSFSRQFLQGLALNANYTYSHALDDISSEYTPLVTTDAHYDYGNGDYDLRHRIAMTATYQLPFGKSYRGIRGAVIRNWEGNAVVSWQTGLPFTVWSNNATINVPGINKDRPDLIGKPINSSHSITGYINVDAFANQTPGTAGDERKDQLFGTHWRSADLSITKIFPIWEKTKLQFRAECFNISNTPSFAAPDNDIGDPQFGQVSSTWGTPRQMQFALKLMF